MDVVHRTMTAAFVMVVPSIHPPYTRRCLDSSRIPASRVLVVDNTEQNRGVAASWNLGLAVMREQRADWLVICSAAVRFGQAGGLDLVEQLEFHGDALAVEPVSTGWHLIALHRRVFDRCGVFDENYWPAYFEDVDMGRRITLAFGDSHGLWPKVDVDASVVSNAHGVVLAGVDVNAPRLAAYYRSKWGGDKDHEKFDTPFGQREQPLSYWPSRRKSW